MKLSTLFESTTLPKVDSLNDLKGATEPVNVTGDVDLRNENIDQLPVRFGRIGKNFYCSSNNLTSLAGSPDYVEEDFSCYNNMITSLDGAPHHIGEELNCSNNQITSLVSIHKIIKSCGQIFISKNPIKEGGLGLLLIKDLEYIVSELPALKIINKYLGKGKRGMIDCQTELIKAGYKEFAKL